MSNNEKLVRHLQTISHYEGITEGQASTLRAGATALESAEAEIVRLQGVIADAKNFTRYTLNARWALDRITSVLTATPKEVTK